MKIVNIKLTYRHLTFEIRYEIISLILLNIVVSKQNKKLRICNNFIQDLNLVIIILEEEIIENQVSMR